MSYALSFVPIRLARYLRQLRLLAKIILLYPLQEPQVGCLVFDLARTLVGCYLSLLAPTLHISTPEHFKCFVLADELWVVGILLEQMHDPCGHIIEECRILDAHVREVEVVHYPLISCLCVYLFAPFINGFEPVVGLAPTPKEHTHCGKHGKAKHLVEEEMQEKRECCFVLFLTEEEEYANTAHEGENGDAED
nr:MAG TPA: hypothetical protein [Caudoviricetes sp.]